MPVERSNSSSSTESSTSSAHQADFRNAELAVDSTILSLVEKEADAGDAGAHFNHSRDSTLPFQDGVMHRACIAAEQL